MARAKVGADDVRVGAHLFGCAVANLLAVVQHHHAVADVHDHPHVVFDQDYGGAKLVVHVQHEAAHVLFLFHVHAGHGLVEQQHLRLHGQGTAQVHAFLQAVGQLAHRCLAVSLDFEEVDDVFDVFAVACFFTLCGADPQRLHQQVAFDLEVAPGHDVVHHTHALEQRQVLESARHTHLRHLARVHVAEGFATEGDGAVRRGVDPVDAVQHRAFACAVGADDGADLMLTHVE